MIIEEIHILNFEALKDVHLRRLPAMSGFVGKNGPEKTAFDRVRSFGITSDQAHPHLKPPPNPPPSIPRPGGIPAGCG
jgi:hypothetical protein